MIARYRKMFPWMPFEKGTTPGSEFCVFDIPGKGRFGLCICYDMWFPEVSRNLVWMGAEVILQPTMTPTSDRPLELVMSQANAIFNQCYFVSINGVGPYGGGRSQIVDPDGRVMQVAGEHQTILTEILDLDHVSRTREFGTIGLAQTLKQIRDSQQTFPVYQGASVQGGSFVQLGPLQFPRDLRLESQIPGNDPT
jgi:predicted amidohydrolase